MDTDFPKSRKLHRNAPIPTGFPRFLGYHGTGVVTAKILMGSGTVGVADPSTVFRRGQMGLGLYISTHRPDAEKFSERGEDGIANREGRVLRVFCDDALGSSKGTWFNPGDYPERDGGVDVPPALMDVPFLRNTFDFTWIKINPAFLKHLRFIK